MDGRVKQRQDFQIGNHCSCPVWNQTATNVVKLCCVCNVSYVRNVGKFVTELTEATQTTMFS